MPIESPSTLLAYAYMFSKEKGDTTKLLTIVTKYARERNRLDLEKNPSDHIYFFPLQSHLDHGTPIVASDSKCEAT